MSALGSLMADGSIGRQLLVWGVLNQLVSQLVTPITQQIMDEIFPVLPSTPLAPATLADMVVRGVIDEAEGEDEAKHSGLSVTRFRRLVHATGDPLAIGQLLEAFRRDIIPKEAGKGGPPSLMEGIRQSRLRDMWSEKLIELQWQVIPVADAVEAVVKGQTDFATGAKFARWNGVKEEDFQLLYNAAGNPPSPTELLELYKRGYIGLTGKGSDKLTVEQGIAEGRTKNKWFAPMTKLAEYLPPPRTVTALEREGTITQDQALHLYEQHGLSAELAAAYIQSASHQKTAKARELAESQVLTLYEEHVIDTARATGYLHALGYHDADISLLLALKDFHRVYAAMSKAVNKIEALYVARKITETEASGALDGLEVPTAQRDRMLAVWTMERSSTIRILTEAQVVSAFKHKVMDQSEAERALSELGYTPYDAWVLLSISNGAPLDDKPAEGQNVPGRAQ